MGKRGPKPLPSNVRVLHGNLGGGNPVNQREPKPPANRIPRPPAWLQKFGREEWRRVAKTLWTIGTLTEIDAGQLAAYCEAFGRYRQAVLDFNKMADADATTHGVVMKTQGGNFIQNPQLGAMNKLRREALVLAAEFGLTPSARTQIDAFDRAGAGGDPIARKYGLR